MKMSFFSPSFTEWMEENVISCHSLAHSQVEIDAEVGPATSLLQISPLNEMDRRKVLLITQNFNYHRLEVVKNNFGKTAKLYLVSLVNRITLQKRPYLVVITMIVSVFCFFAGGKNRLVQAMMLLNKSGRL